MMCLGLDIGGAHLKAAAIAHGKLTTARQVLCPLWQGLEQLEAALAEISDLVRDADNVAITMTGELTEIFESRQQGVTELTGRLAKHFGADVKIFAGLNGLVTPEQAVRNPDDVGSANFLATARLIAQLQDAPTLLLDMGSTTTDLTIAQRPFGLTDAERLQTGELVYTGLTRTPVASVVRRAPLAGQWQAIASDAFANMADVHRVLGALPKGVDLHGTTDGKGKSQFESLTRLARGFGRDAEARHLEKWQVSARYIREQQLQDISEGVSQVLSRPGPVVSHAVVAGIGWQEVAEVARRAGLQTATFGDLIECAEHLRLAATYNAPAVAIAYLAAGSAGEAA